MVYVLLQFCMCLERNKCRHLGREHITCFMCSTHRRHPTDILYHISLISNFMFHLGLHKPRNIDPGSGRNTCKFPLLSLFILGVSRQAVCAFSSRTLDQFQPAESWCICAPSEYRGRQAVSSELVLWKN